MKQMKYNFIFLSIIILIFIIFFNLFYIKEGFSNQTNNQTSNLSNQSNQFINQTNNQTSNLSNQSNQFINQTNNQTSNLSNQSNQFINQTNNETSNLSNQTGQFINQTNNQTGKFINQTNNQTGKFINQTNNQTGKFINQTNNQTSNLANQTNNLYNQFKKQINKFGTQTSNLYNQFKQPKNIVKNIQKETNKIIKQTKEIGNQIQKEINANKLKKEPIFTKIADIFKNNYIYIIILAVFFLLYIIIAKTLPDIYIFKTSLLILFGFVISGLLIYQISYNIENLIGSSNSLKFTLNLLLVTIILGLIYKTIYTKLPVDSNINGFFNLIFTIPGLLNGLFNIISKDSSSTIMLLLVFSLFLIYFKSSTLLNFISTQGGIQLVNRPVYTNLQYNLGGYHDLNGNKDDFNYKYAISFWLFLDAAGPNMNTNYNKYTSVLNFGKKPNILYNGKTHTLIITMQQKDLKNITKNKLIDFDDEDNRIIYENNNLLLQKWNNLILNYNGGTLDIFLNGKLVKSSIEVVPYYTFENLTIGENDGIKGGICNVVYFRNTLTARNIYYLYNAVKDRTPPLLSDSNETILVNKTELNNLDN